jgi:hypothetical protein
VHVTEASQRYVVIQHTACREEEKEGLQACEGAEYQMPNGQNSRS